MFQLTADTFPLRNHSIIYLGFFLFGGVFLFVVLFFFGLWWFFSEKQFDGDIVYDSMIVASPGPRKVESLDLINNSVRMDVQLEENGAWAWK